MKFFELFGTLIGITTFASGSVVGKNFFYYKTKFLTSHSLIKNLKNDLEIKQTKINENLERIDAINKLIKSSNKIYEMRKNDTQNLQKTLTESQDSLSNITVNKNTNNVNLETLKSTFNEAEKTYNKKMTEIKTKMHAYSNYQSNISTIHNQILSSNTLAVQNSTNNNCSNGQNSGNQLACLKEQLSASRMAEKELENLNNEKIVAEHAFIRSFYDYNIEINKISEFIQKFKEARNTNTFNTQIYPLLSSLSDKSHESLKGHRKIVNSLIDKNTKLQDEINEINLKIKKNKDKIEENKGFIEWIKEKTLNNLLIKSWL